jgi:antibiotic biosynthesis monooxygenase (ABM) superfamily enzyme
MSMNATSMSNARLSNRSEQPARSPGRPLRWKMAAITWLGIYPSITVTLATAEPLLVGLPLVVRTLALTVVLAPAMTFLIMPVLTKALAAWLQSPRWI